MRRRLAVVVILCAAGLGVGLTADVAGGADRPRARLSDYFSNEEIARADRYRGPRYLLGFGALGLSLVVLGLLGLGAGSRRLGGWAASVSGGRWWLTTLLVTAAVVLIPAIVTLPLAIARHRHDRAYGLATNTLPGYLADVGKGIGFELAIGAIVALGFVGIARGLPRGWPWAVAGGGALLTVALVFLFPVVYEPAFNKFTPVNAETRSRVLEIAERAGVHVRDVLVADASRRTTRQNAYVSGIGSTRRVVLYDTLLRKSPPREVDTVVAHELAHVKHRDVLRGTVLGVVGVVAGVVVLWRLLSSPSLLGLIGASGPGDPRAVAFLAFFVAAANLLTMPAVNAISRRAEARADRTAIELTRDPDAAVRLEVNLARDNMADLTPHPAIVWAFFTHPPVLDRIEIALRYRAER